jgi:2,4-dichlorophenol 6-monooxygenase
MSRENIETNVLIVGGGPTGLFASILFSQCRIPHVLIERRVDVIDAPAAHVINVRTAEIFRQAGIDMDALYALDHHPEARLITWSQLPGAPVLGQLDISANKESLKARNSASQDHSANISQHLLERFLRGLAEKSEFSDIRFGVKWEGFSDSQNRVSTVSSINSDNYSISADYVLAADGAGSSVSRALGIQMIGPDNLATFLNLSCEVSVDDVFSESGTLLYWLVDPEMRGVMIVHDPKRLAVVMQLIDVPYETFDDYDDARCESLLDKIFRGNSYRLIHKSVWRMTAQIAEEYRKGNVFLVGDSAHRFPPTGGLGLNTAVADVHNLVWKLAAVINHDLDFESQENLFDSYESERKPVAQRNTNASNLNNEKMMEVVEALGLDPSKANLLQKIMNSFLIRHLPKVLRQTIKEALLKPARALIAAAAANDQEGEEIRKKISKAIDNQEEHFNTLGLDLGYIYKKGVVSSEAAFAPESEVMTYTPSFTAGARLPHHTIERDGELSSTLDLGNYHSFLSLKSGESREIDFPTFGYSITEVDVADLGVKEIDLDEGAYLLVRPDGHIAVRGNH